MGKHERAKRRRQEKHERRREQAKKLAKARALPTTANALVELAATGSFGPAWVTEGLGDDPEAPDLAMVMITRKLPRGQWLAHLLLVDRTCMGVRNGFLLPPCSQEGFAEHVAELAREGHRLERCEPAWAQSLVLHAVEYAASLGFSPHRDFHPTLVLPRPEPLLDTPLCRPSRPVYVEGPHDERDRILAYLIRRVGPEGFGFVRATRKWTRDDAEEADWDDEEEDDDWDDDEPLVITSPRPPQPLSDHAVGPGLLAWTLVQRYVHGMSAERLAERLAEYGIGYDADDVDGWHRELAGRCTDLLDAMELEAGRERVWSTTDALDVTEAYAVLLDGCCAHELDPEPYLRELLCLMPEWPEQRIGELAPAHWRRTTMEEPARGMLERHARRYREVGVDYS